MNYLYANIKEENGDIATYPNGNINDYTILKNKRLGDFVNYINNEVLNNNQSINKPFFYDLVSIEFIDPELVDDKSAIQFKKLMAHCISIANVFWNKDVRINKCIYDYNDRTTYKYGVTYKGKEDIWIMKNVHGEKEFFFKNGENVYESNMFSKQPLKLWEEVVENFFFNNIEEVNSNSNQIKEDFNKSYQFANVKYIKNGIAVFPNGTVNDDTIIKKMKIGVFIDFVNAVVLENNCNINKPLFYDLISVEILDSNIADIDSVQSFTQKVAFCLAISKSFGNDNVRIKNGIFEYTHYKMHKYIVTWNGKEDIWILDGDRDKFYIENGNTEYKSFPYIDNNGKTEYISILDRKRSIPIWIFTVDTFFYNSAKTLEFIGITNPKPRSNKSILNIKYDNKSNVDLESVAISDSTSITLSNPKPKSNKSISYSKSNNKSNADLESVAISESTSITLSNHKIKSHKTNPSLSCGCTIM